MDGLFNGNGRSKNLQEKEVNKLPPITLSIVSPKMSTHKDGLNRGTQETQILHP
jgi:hypothetical protein